MGQQLMKRKIKQVLEAQFAGIEVDFDKPSGERVNGHVVWEGFTGHDHVDRQQRVRQALRDGLGADAQQVGILLTYTPRELRAMMAA